MFTNSWLQQYVKDFFPVIHLSYKYLCGSNSSAEITFQYKFTVFFFFFKGPVAKF